MAEKEASGDWASKFGRPGTAPTPEGSQVSVPAPPTAAAARVAKIAVTYRFEADVLELIDRATAAAAARGERLSKEAAVAHAIRETYEDLR